jgi:hypothetical protein
MRCRQPRRKPAGRPPATASPWAQNANPTHPGKPTRFTKSEAAQRREPGWHFELEPESGSWREPCTPQMCDRPQQTIRGFKACDGVVAQGQGSMSASFTRDERRHAWGRRSFRGIGKKYFRGCGTKFRKPIAIFLAAFNRDPASIPGGGASVQGNAQVLGVASYDSRNARSCRWRACFGCQ